MKTTCRAMIRMTCVWSALVWIGACAPAGSSNQNSNGNNDNTGTSDNDNTGPADNDNGTGGGKLTLGSVVDTGVGLRGDGFLSAAPGYIVFETAGDQSTPAVYDMAAAETLEITTADGTTLASDFAISGSTVIIRNETNDGVYAFNAATPTQPASRVDSPITLSTTSAGFIDSDGGGIVAFVTSEPQICWIDVNVAPLDILTFGRRPDNGAFAHVAVSGRQIAFFDGKVRLEIRDVDTGGLVAGVSINALTDFGLAFRDGVAAYADADSGEIVTVDAATGERTSSGIVAGGPGFQTTLGSQVLATAGGTVCGFASEPIYSGSTPSVFGPAGGALTTAPQGVPGFRVPPGWGTTCAVSPGGALVFVAGSGAPTDAQSDLLSAWRSAKMELVEEFEGAFAATISFEPAVPTASDVVTTSGFAAFKLYAGPMLGANVGYITFTE